MCDKRADSSFSPIHPLSFSDNPPVFDSESYLFVVTELVGADALIGVVHADDVDEGFSGEVRYELLNEGDAAGLIKLDPKSGELRTKIMLRAKGREEPYEILVRALDNGDQIPKQKSLFSDTHVKVYIGDVCSNDGVPFIISPAPDEIAFVYEVIY